MKNLWKNSEAQSFQHNNLSLRVYTSRLLGKCPELVLHGGGNTSVKGQYKNIFGEKIETLFINGSGWDLISIEEDGFAPVNLNDLIKLSSLNYLSDSQMVVEQKLATLKPNAPNPSVEAILHALIPYTFVDHTHADAVLSITNTPNGRAKINEIYNEEILIVPYVMPGFILAKKIAELNGINQTKLDTDFNLFYKYEWPGNVRELRNLVERISILSVNEKKIDLNNLVKDALLQKNDQETSNSYENVLSYPLKTAREKFEKDYLTSQLKKHKGNISKTAEFVGMERSALHRKLKTLGIKGVN